MNRVLVRNGFLEGEPGDYTPTEKAEPYVEEKYYHRGCGGYAFYNRSWTTRTYDPSIIDELNIDDEVIEDVRAEVRELRTARQAERRKAAEEYDARMQALRDAEISEQVDDVLEYFNPMSVIEDNLLLFVGLCAIGFIGYKLFAWVKQMQEEKKKEEKKKEEEKKREKHTIDLGLCIMEYE